MITPPRALRPALALLTLGAVALGTLTGCAPAQAGVQPAGPSLSPYATRADAATLVFRTQAARAGAVDVLLDGTPILRQVRPTDSYRVTTLSPGQYNLSVRNSLNGVLLADVTANLQGNESYALLFDLAPTGGEGIEYRLRLGQGSAAVSNLVY
ncbi:hypothetical protein DAETH_32370 [Deinococcus aetherius]|uniref:DUF4397 domain-containing protein n=1 Tax=Deinococcus aetherius TaxID=200252 RepID=A0ABM8AHH9_9DEIO|nr:DUF4397 domain-containing protein [Deinococcus aetherius]BDP43268.1 hypothetical protein DAETH_32370 [Deinococcus aetherius]